MFHVNLVSQVTYQHLMKKKSNKGRQPDRKKAGGFSRPLLQAL